MSPVLIGATVGGLVGWIIFRLLKIDWRPGKFKVIFHEGAEVNIRTKMLSGWLTIDTDQVRIAGKHPLSFPLAHIQSADIFRLHGLGRMIRVIHQGGTLNITVVRFCIAGQFATIDFFKTGTLAERLSPANNASATGKDA
jgi:hypothetical protein